MNSYADNIMVLFLFIASVSGLLVLLSWLSDMVDAYRTMTAYMKAKEERDRY